MDMISSVVEKRFKKAPIRRPFRSGDTVKVHVKIKEGEKSRTQIFEGLVLRVKNGGLGSSFTVRKVSNGVGVERTFPFYSPSVEKVDLIARGSTRQSRLFYVRKLEGKAARISSELVAALGKEEDVKAPANAEQAAAAAEAAEAAAAPATEAKEDTPKKE